MITIFFYSMLVLLGMLVVYVKRKDKAEYAVGALTGILAAFVVYVGGMILQASSYEILSGQVTGKSWHYDPETESYSCGTDGKETCTRQVPRWRWDVESDTGSPYSEHTYVQASPDIWDGAKVGEPFARNKWFINYQYVHKQSVLFDQDVRYEGWLPEYPDIIMGFRVNRCMSNVVDCEELGRQLQIAHKRWGNQFQVNALVAVVHEKAVGFADALRAKWTGGKKNDTILVLYVDGDLKVTRVEVFGRSTSNKRNAEYADFNLILREQAVRIGVFDEQKIVAALDSALQYFERENLDNYDFMANAYQPPAWVTALHILLIALAMLAAVAKYRKETRYSYRR